MKRIGLALVLLLVSGTMTLPSVARAEVRYTVIDLGTLGGATSKAYGLNDADPVQVVGAADVNTGKDHAFLWRNGQIHDLGTFNDCSESTAFDINEDAEVVGEGRGTQTESIDCWRGFSWKPGAQQTFPGTMTPLGGPQPSDDWAAGCFVTSGKALNDAGTMAGTGQVLFEVNDNPVCTGAAFRWPPAGEHEVFGQTTIGRHKSANDISADGTIGGAASYQDEEFFHGEYRAALWAPITGNQTFLDTRAGAQPSDNFYSSVNGLADDHDAVGQATTSNGQTHAYLWESPGDGTDLGTLPEPYDCYTSANAINNQDQIVGINWGRDVNDLCGSQNSHAFLYENDEMLDLNDLIAEDTGWVLREATDINEGGRIVGWGVFNGQTHGFLLDFQGLDPELWDVFALDAAPVTEGGGSGGASVTTAAQTVKSKFVVKRSEVGDASTIKYATKDDTAKAGKDYVAKNGTLTFGEDAKKKTIYVKILNNNKKEQTEKFFLVLSKPSDNLQITDKKAKATIKDDD